MGQETEERWFPSAAQELAKPSVMFHFEVSAWQQQMENCGQRLGLPWSG